MRSRVAVILVAALLLLGSGCSVYQHSLTIVRGHRLSQAELEDSGMAMTPERRLAYGIRLEESGELEKAEEQYHKVLAIGTHDSVALTNLGNVYMAKRERSMWSGRWLAKAVRCYLKALDIEPDSMIVRNNLADAHNIQGKPLRSIQVLSGHMKSGPGASHCHTTLGEAYDQLGRYDESLESYLAAEAEALKDSPPDNDLLNLIYGHLSAAYLKVGKRNQALAYREKARGTSK